MPSHTNQLDSGPAVKTNVLVHPRFAAKLHNANAYAENTAGPIRAESSAANFWAVSPAHTAACERTAPAVAHVVVARCGSASIAIADILGSGMLPFWIFRCTSNAEGCVDEQQTISSLLSAGSRANVTEAGKEFIGRTRKCLNGKGFDFQ